MYVCICGWAAGRLGGWLGRLGRLGQLGRLAVRLGGWAAGWLGLCGWVAGLPQIWYSTNDMT